MTGLGFGEKRMICKKAAAVRIVIFALLLSIGIARAPTATGANPINSAGETIYPGFRAELKQADVVATYSTESSKGIKPEEKTKQYGCASVSPRGSAAEVKLIS